LEAFRQGLRELGWIEGQTVTIEYRWAEGKADQLPALADELVRAKVDVMVVAGGLGLRAGQRATSTIPIVFVILNDPVAVGLVKSFAHPGGNATGLASQFEELITKQLQLLKEAIPSISRIALLHHQLSVSTRLPLTPLRFVAWDTWAVLRLSPVCRAGGSAVAGYVTQACGL
jgi:ABC-type uncharacterized transport system substrate-binding protein